MDTAETLRIKARLARQMGVMFSRSAVPEVRDLAAECYEQARLYEIAAAIMEPLPPIQELSA